MAKDYIPSYDTSPANNTDVDGINIAEGCAPGNINNAIREVMADVAEAVQVRAISSATTLALSDHGKVIECDASSSGFTVTLPAASSSTGATYTIKKTDSSSNAVTVDANASETIDGSTTQTLDSQYDAFTIRCDGSEWFVVSVGQSAPFGTFAQQDTGSVDTDIIPDTDSTRDLGSASAAWAEAHADKVLTNTLEDAGTGNSDAVQDIIDGRAKAWVNGSVGASPNEAFNISSGTDQGTGDYDYFFSNAMKSTANPGCANADVPSFQRIGNLGVDNDSMTVRVFDDDGTPQDERHCGIMFGPLA
jgi:hypothetical protein